MKISPSAISMLAVLATASAFQSPAVVEVRSQPHINNFNLALFSTASESLEHLPTPPKKSGFLRRFRDTISMLKDPDGTIAARTAELGPVFEMYQFFKPIVVVGGQDAVKEFISGSELKSEVIYPDLPDSFLDLHTKWGALNLDANDQIFKEARLLFAEVLSSVEAMSFYTKTIEPEIDAYVEKIAKRIEADPSDNTVYLAPELIDLTLQIFSKIFSGKGLNSDQVQMFVDYNAALLSISKNSDQYRKGMDALVALREEMINRFNSFEGSDLPDDAPGKFYHSKVYGREGFENPERIATGMVLFIWGAYVECASLMADSLALMVEYNDINARENILKEFELRTESGDSTPQDYSFWKGMDYTRGVCRETLRVKPPGAGVPRYGNNEFELAGYRIPAKMSVVLDPRIGNMDPGLYTNPKEFQPLRWTPASSKVANDSSSKCPFQGSALKLGLGSWFPGGNGAHKCPGVPLAELISSMFLTKMSQRFESWEYNGDGLDKDGSVKYNMIPIRIPPDDFGMNFKLAPKAPADSLRPSKEETVLAA